MVEKTEKILKEKKKEKQQEVIKIIDVDVIRDNVDRVLRGEALTLPLSVLNGKLKKALYRQSAKHKAYLQSAKHKAYRKAYQKAYYEAKKAYYKAYQKAYYEAKKAGKVKKCI